MTKQGAAEESQHDIVHIFISVNKDINNMVYSRKLKWLQIYIA
jgi:hypothetical protein